MSETYIVICLDDTPASPNPGARLACMVLATRRIFSSQEDAEAYARTISYTRYPGVVAGDFANLRLQQE